MGNSSNRRRPSTAVLAAGAVLGALLGLTACSDDGEGPALPTSAPSVDRPSRTPVDRPSQDEPEPTDDAESPAAPVSPSARPTRTQRTTAAPAPEPTRTTTPTKPAAPKTTAARTAATTATTTATTTRPADPATAESALSGTAADDTSGLGTLGWLLLILLAAGAVGGVLVWRSKRKSDWTAGAAVLEADTRAVVGMRLPPVLATVTTAQRALSWPPVRSELTDLVGRWALLAENAPGEQRATWSRRVWGLLDELIAAVDVENEALANGQPWQPMRFRVDETVRVLTATLRGDQGAGPDPSLA